MKSVSVRSYTFFILIVLASVVELYAQFDPVTVMESSLRAIGSAKDIAVIRSIHSFADCIGPKRNYTTELSSARGSRLIFKQVFPGGSYVGHANGKTFWTTDEKTGDHTLVNETAAFVWRSHDYQMLAIEPGERFKDLDFESEETFGGKNAIKFSATDELGKPAAVYFEKETKLFLGFTIRNPFSDQPETIRTVFNEWKKVGKLKLPSRVTVTDKTGDFVLNFKNISLNKPDEKVFSVPVQVIAMTELYELHKKARADHFNRDAAAMAAGFADDFTNVAHGKITKPTRDESFQRFKNYFGRSAFIEWDDITPPVIKVSDDATMGYTIVHKRVKLLSKGDDGSTAESTEVFAWVTLYRKIGGKWQLTGVASTNTPEADK